MGAHTNRFDYLIFRAADRIDRAEVSRLSSAPHSPQALPGKISRQMRASGRLGNPSNVTDTIAWLLQGNWVTSQVGSDWLTALTVRLRWAFGLLLTINFAIFWALPIAIQGQAYKLGLHRVLDPIYDFIDRSSALRCFATRFIYAKPVHAVYFARALLLVFSTALALGVVFYWQIAHGSLPIWLILLHYFAWVGFGGRIMGAAYTFAHKEGHRPGGRLYRPWIRNTVGNFFENWLGFFYGNVPYNFSTSHNLLHHSLNAGKGDPVYLWDLDRTSWSDLMLYQHRLFVYMTGWGSLRAFKNHAGNRQLTDKYKLLRKGFCLYWLVIPAIIIAGLLLAGNTAQSSLSFLFFIYVQPLCAMSVFLGFINVAQHGFLQFEEDGAHIPCINSMTIVDGQDDSFGEDDHMAHHYYPAVEHVDLKDHQRTQQPEWIRRHASVFKELPILELAIYMLLNKWDLIAKKHYVDYSGNLTTGEIARMLEERAQRKEMSYEEYEFSYLPAIGSVAEELVRRGTCRNLTQAYRYQAHYNVQRDSFLCFDKLSRRQAQHERKDSNDFNTASVRPEVLEGPVMSSSKGRPKSVSAAA